MITHLRNSKGRALCNPKLGGFVTYYLNRCNCKDCKQKNSTLPKSHITLLVEQLKKRKA